MKRFLFLLTAAIMALSLAACGVNPPAQTAQTATAATPPAAATQEPATPAATPSATPTPVPTQTPAPTPTATPVPTASPTPQPTASFTPATALADKIMKEKKWSNYKYAAMVRDAIAILLANSTACKPEQLAAKLRKNVDKIVIANKVPGWGYEPRKKAIYLDTASATPEALVYSLTYSISGFSEYMKYPWGKIKGSTWCFGTNKSVYLGKREASFRLMIGLEDFISSRNMPDAVVSNAGCEFNGTMVMLQYYSDGNRGLPSEQGFSILFYYAAGSRDVEKTFFGDKKASDAYKAAFAKRFGAKKLAAVIALVDTVSLYHGYTAGMTVAQQKEGLEKIKAYEVALLGLLKTRQKGLKTQKERDEFLGDLAQFEKFNMQIDENGYQQKITDRIAAIRKAALDKEIA